MTGKVWVFTGGAHAAGGFSEYKGFRNSAGLFEEVIRWDMYREQVAGRENFVFNTACPGLDILGVIRAFDDRVARYRPAGVIYISGAEDGELDAAVYGESLRTLRGMAEGIGARFLEIAGVTGPEGEGDSLEEANQLLDQVCGGRSLVKPEDKKRLTLEGAGEVFGRGGKFTLFQEPMRWLFVGDSITHGALHTFGYDSLPQLWEKYIRGDWGRKDDTVLNTGVSGAVAGELLERLDVRYTPYADAQVVVVMFGTNDCAFPGTISVRRFKEQLRTFTDLARSHGSQVVIRTPQPLREDAGERGERLVLFAEAARETAREADVLLVDHYYHFARTRQEDPERFRRLMSDAIHPNAQGQYRMFREMAYSLGMVKENSMVSLQYV